MKTRALSSLGMLMVVLMVLAMPASADGKGNILRVGPGQEYETIQAAVDAAKQGSRIPVYPDLYEESVTVTTNNLQLIAQGSDVIVTPPPTEPGFDVNADHVSIQGLEIVGAECADGITFQGSQNTFAENNIHGFTGPCRTTALHCADEDGGSDYNTIEDNVLFGADEEGAYHGIHIFAASDALNKGNIIKNNTITGMEHTCIYVVNGTAFRISGNNIQSCRYGIVLEAGSGAVSTHNHIASNSVGLTSDGLRLAAGPGATVRSNLLLGNLVYHHQGNGVSLSAGSDHNSILNNEVQSGRLGIAVAGDYNLIAHNWSWNHYVDIEDTGVGNRWRNNKLGE
jgi:parallel beta-helix repeat protein